MSMIWWSLVFIGVSVAELLLMYYGLYFYTSMIEKDNE